MYSIYCKYRPSPFFFFKLYRDFQQIFQLNGLVLRYCTLIRYLQNHRKSFIFYLREDLVPFNDSSFRLIALKALWNPVQCRGGGEIIVSKISYPIDGPLSPPPLIGLILKQYADHIIIECYVVLFWVQASARFLPLDLWKSTPVRYQLPLFHTPPDVVAL